jgi:hypothetical protein
MGHDFSSLSEWADGRIVFKIEAAFSDGLFLCSAARHGSILSDLARSTLLRTYRSKTKIADKYLTLPTPFLYGTTY